MDYVGKPNCYHELGKLKLGYLEGPGVGYERVSEVGSDFALTRRFNVVTARAIQ